MRSGIRMVSSDPATNAASKCCRIINSMAHHSIACFSLRDESRLTKYALCLEPAQQLDIYSDWLRFRISAIIQVTLATNAQLLGYFHPDTYFESSLAESK